MEIVTGDEFEKAEGMLLPRVVKIKVEGIDLAVFQGLRATPAPPACEPVAGELHPSVWPQGTASQAIELPLMAIGFKRIGSFPRWDGTFCLTAFKGGALVQ